MFEDILYEDIVHVQYPAGYCMWSQSVTVSAHISEQPTQCEPQRILRPINAKKDVEISQSIRCYSIVKAKEKF